MSTMEAENPPNETVYVNNLEERIKIEELKEVLRELFSEYGEVLDVIAHKNLRARGQAYVVFQTTESAQRAIDEVNGFEMFGKKMRLAFAKSKSDVIVNLQDGPDALKTHQQARLAQKEQRKEEEEEKAKAKASQSDQTVPTSSDVGAAGKLISRGAGLKSTAVGAATVADEYVPPNKTLFLQNVPTELQETEQLASLFESFAGFKEVRVPPGRKGLAFVEYSTEAEATAAKEAMSGKVLTDSAKPLKVTYQKQ